MTIKLDNTSKAVAQPASHPLMAGARKRQPRGNSPRHGPALGDAWFHGGMGKAPDTLPRTGVIWGDGFQRKGMIAWSLGFYEENLL